MTTTEHPASGSDTSAEARIRAVHAVLDCSGYTMSPSKVTRLVRDFNSRVARNGFEFFDYVVNVIRLDDYNRRKALTHPDVARVVSYSDPTGETAVRNVLRGGAR